MAAKKSARTTASRSQGSRSSQAATRDQSVSSESGEHLTGNSPDSPAAFVKMLLRENRPGLYGFLLSVLQLAGHGSWLLLVQRTIHTGEAAQMNSESSTAWLIVSILGISMLLTLIAMFVCLYYGLRRPPRILPLTGLGLSFFTGVFATFAVLLG